MTTMTKSDPETARFTIRVTTLDGHTVTLNRQFDMVEMEREIDTIIEGGGICVETHPVTRSFSWQPSSQIRQIDVTEINPHE
jgi:hypothetical protein